MTRPKGAKRQPRTPRESAHESARAPNSQPSESYVQEPKSDKKDAELVADVAGDIVETGGSSPRARAPVGIPRLAPLADLTDPLELKRSTLEALDVLVSLAVNNERMTRDGEFYPAPDFSAAIRAVEAGARVLGVDKTDPKVLIAVHGEASALIEKARGRLESRKP